MIHKQGSLLFLIVILAVFLFAYVAVGQESILSFTLFPEKVENTSRWNGDARNC